MNDFPLQLSSRPRWRELWSLTKPRVVQLIVFCAFIGMLMAIKGWPALRDWEKIAIACTGIWLVAACAAAMNCLLESSIDARMDRTAWRPTARASFANWQVLLFASALGLAGCQLLFVYVNPLTMWLTLATLIGYAFVYTVILKPLTSQNIVIGGASGAMPPVLGWAAMQGSLSLEPILLFLIIFVWTPPHFWALALYRVEDYRHSGLPMLPVTHGMTYTARHVFFYTIALLAVSLLPFIFAFSSWFYLGVALLCGFRFCWYGHGLWKHYSDRLARQAFRWSLWHLSALFVALLLDHYLF